MDSLSTAEMLPTAFTPGIIEHLTKALAGGFTRESLFASLNEATDEALITGELQAYWDAVDASGVDVVNATIGVEGADLWSYDNAIRDIARWEKRFYALDRFLKVRSAADVERAHAQNKRGIILGFQNCLAIGEDLDRLDQFHQLGVRVIQLTYNPRSLIGDGCTERTNAGLSNFGVSVVRRMNELGILVDLAHCGEQTTLDGIEFSDRPVALTHTFARAVHDHPRGKSDEVLRRVRDSGSYIGVCLVPFFLTSDPKPALSHFIDHVKHIVDITGPECVGIGTDQAGYGGADFPKEMLLGSISGLASDVGFAEDQVGDFTATVDGYESWRDWPNLTEALLESGFSADEVRGFIGGNFFRVFRQAVG